MIDKLIHEIISKRNPTIVGLDTRLEYIPIEYICRFTAERDLDLHAASEIIFSYNKEIIDKIWDIVPAVKVQIAYYEMYGVPGMNAFYQTCAYAKQKGLYVVGDVKRNDIGATAEAYAAAYLGKTSLAGISEQQAFPVDCITVNPYLGYDGIQPFIESCAKFDKSIFVLVKTSNTTSNQLQDLEVMGKPVYEIVGDYTREWGENFIGSHGYSNVGAVVGATYPEQGQRLREILPNVFFLVPGYGAQGAGAGDVVGMFDEKGLGAVVNSSRNVLCAYQKTPWKERFTPMEFAKAARQEVLRMKEEFLIQLAYEGKLQY